MLPANVELNDSYIYMHTNILEVNSIFRLDIMNQASLLNEPFSD